MSNESLNIELHLCGKILKISLMKDQAKFSSDTISIHSITQSLLSFRHKSLMDDPSFVENILIERLQVPDTQILFFASEAFALSRSEGQKNINQNNPRAQRLLAYLQEIIVNYASLSLYQSEMFPEQGPYFDRQEGAKLAASRSNDFLIRGGPKDFFLQVIGYLDREAKDFKESLVLEMAVNLNITVKAMSLLNDPIPIANVFKILIENNLISELLQKHLYYPAWNTNEIEFNSILGPFLHPNLFPRAPYFSKMSGIPPPADPVREKIGSEMRSMRYQKDFERIIELYSNNKKNYSLILTDIFKALLRVEKKNTMDWLIDVVVKSSDRSKLGNRMGAENVLTNASDGFCLNLFDVLLQMCAPFLDLNSQHVGKISEKYLAGHPRMEKIRESPICNTIEKMKIAQQEVGTVTEYYFCCVLMFNYSWSTACGFTTDLNRVIQRIKEKNSPDKSDLEYFTDILHCFEVILIDPYRNSLILKLCNLTTHLIIKWTGFAGSIPLPQVSPILSIIPEFFIEDIAEFFIMMLQMPVNTMKQMTPSDYNNFLNLSLIMLIHPEQFTNPYIRAKFVKTLSLIISNNKLVGDIASVMNSNRLFQEFFIQALVRFFVDIEFGGGHSQFYDKFEYRHYASIIFEYLWKIPIYQQRTISLQSDEFFKKFINYILNDMGYCLQEGIDNLVKIKKTRQKPKNELTEEDLENISKNSGLCKYMFQQSNEIISMLRQISEWNSELFISDEFGRRTAELLNSFLDQLCGPKCLELDASNKEEFKFDQMALLGNLVSIYLNISKHDLFIECIARDGRSFKIDLFKEAQTISNRFSILSWDQKQMLRVLVKKLTQFSPENNGIPDEDVPEEFCCELTYELMKNPIRLPSGKAVERVNIVRHLLSDEKDPFSRQPLKISELVEDLELKRRIEEWIVSKRNS